MKSPWIVAMILLAIAVRAQDNPLFLEPTKKEADSLRKTVTQNIDDTLRMAAYRDLSIYYLDINADSALHYAELDLPLAQKLNLRLWEADAWDLVAIAASGQGNFAKSLKAFTEGLRIAQDPECEKNIWRISSFTNSARPEFARLSMLATIQSDMASLYQATENHQQELTTVRTSIKTAARIEDNTLLSQCYRALADIHQRENRLDSALILYKLALNYAGKAGFQKYSNLSYDQIGNIYIRKQMIPPALQSYRNALRSSMEQNNISGAGNTFVLLARYHNGAGFTDSALYYAKKGLEIARTAGRVPNLIRAYHVLSSVYKNLGKPDSALVYLQLETAAKDSLLSLDKIKQLQNVGFAEQQRLFELEVAEKDLQARLRTNILLGSTFTLVVIAFFLYRNNRTKQKAKQKVEAAYEQLKATQSQLIQSEKMASLGELTAGIAHEIQNPLNFVNNFSEVNSELIDELRKELTIDNKQLAIKLAEDIKENEAKIVHHGKRADGIVKSMLQHSRKSSGQKELTDINELCDEYFRLAYHGLRAKDKSFNAKFESHLDPTLPKINVVPQDIGRVILNLINNAFYAVSEKKRQNPENYEPVVTVSTSLSPGEGRLPAGALAKAGGEARLVEITVSDNGPGIPDHIKDKIFQPFFTTKPTGQGTGLGLSLSYDIVKAHGGEIIVKTTDGEASEFIVQL